MTRSVIVLGGLSSPIGSAIIDRLISQCYGVCIIDIKRTQVCRLGRLVYCQSYDPGIPGDLDFVVRDMIRRKFHVMNFIAVIDLGYCDDNESGFNHLTTLVPDTNGLEQSLLYILIHSDRVCDKKLRELANYSHRTYLIRIPNLVIIPNNCLGNTVRKMEHCRSPDSRIVSVYDIARLVCDHILRHPLSLRKPVVYFKIDGHEMKNSIPLDLVLVLKKDTNTSAVYDNVEYLYRFSLTCLTDSVRQSRCRLVS
jgi:hypothetical protein